MYSYLTINEDLQMNEIQARAQAILLDDLFCEIAEDMDYETLHNFIDQALYTISMQYIMIYSKGETVGRDMAMNCVNHAFRDSVDMPEIDGNQVNEIKRVLAEAREEIEPQIH